MKKIYRYTLFVLILLIMIILIDLFSFTTPGNIILGRVAFCTGFKKIGTIEILPRIEKVQENNEYTKLIVGDSVSNQMFWNLQQYNEDYCIATSNGGLTVAGQYVLVKLFLENHKNVTDVYLIQIPTTLVSGFESRLTYDYLVAPLSISDKLSYLDATSIEELSNIYGKAFLNKNVVKFINYSPINSRLYLNYSQKNLLSMDDDKIISNEAIFYLKEIEELCSQSDVKFHFLSGPMPNDVDTREKVKQVKEYAEINGENSTFGDYFDNVIYSNSIMFSDGVHFGGLYNNQEIFNIEIEKLQEKTNSLDELQFN